MTIRYFEPWRQFRHNEVRQLAFAVASPNVLSALPVCGRHAVELHQPQDFYAFYQQYLPRLQQLDRQPQPLLDFLAHYKSSRLGIRFEALLHFWLSDPANSFFQLLGYRIQFHQQGKTLGEMDFLLKNRQTDAIEHWEVCLKYYLAVNSLQLQHWQGLNPEDTLAGKLQHCVERQFQFSQALGYPIQRRVAVFKGQLYLPYNHHQPLPSWFNPARRYGYWQATLPQDPQWRRLSRQEWLCPFLSPQQPQPIRWWNDGLYYHPQRQQFLLLQLHYPTRFLYNSPHNPTGHYNK